MKFRYVFRKPEFKEVEGVGTVVESINENEDIPACTKERMGNFFGFFHSRIYD